MTADLPTPLQVRPTPGAGWPAAPDSGPRETHSAERPGGDAESPRAHQDHDAHRPVAVRAALELHIDQHTDLGAATDCLLGAHEALQHRLSDLPN